MRKISLQTKTCYVYAALTGIVNNATSMLYNNEKLSVLVFEEPWITLQDFIDIQQIQIDRTLVIAKKSTIHFLAAILKSERIQYADIDTSVCQLTEIVKKFIHRVQNNDGMCKEKSASLNLKECQILSLYTSGLSIACISRILNIPIKQAYNIKRNFMYKTGLCSDAGLVNYLRIFKHYCKQSGNINGCYKRK
ncbi:TPA: hypothetical protein VGS91_004798 [Citrobacter freundii]|nr:hypothetical protein [Citrobacter freundii]